MLCCGKMPPLRLNPTDACHQCSKSGQSLDKSQAFTVKFLSYQSPVHRHYPGETLCNSKYTKCIGPSLEFLVIKTKYDYLSMESYFGYAGLYQLVNLKRGAKMIPTKEFSEIFI